MGKRPKVLRHEGKGLASCKKPPVGFKHFVRNLGAFLFDPLVLDPNKANEHFRGSNSIGRGISLYCYRKAPHEPRNKEKRAVQQDLCCAWI